ncbi:MAG: IS110 family transposase [Myxococcales bacterium]|nr:IS110 family transposase [Myxococcales bacterium]
MVQEKTRRREVLEVRNPDAAGIDIGSRQHWVAVGAHLDAEPVRSFGTTMSELLRLADWLAACGVTTVAMESTAVYWVPLYEVLEERGLEVLLVNATHARNVKGRKSDVLDCQWIQQLHSYGLLRASFRPSAAIVELRSYTRHRDMLVASAGRHIQHMQKALMLMNVQIHHAVADITGVTGMAIVRAIVAGEREPAALATHRDPRCRHTVAELIDALRGNYKPEHLFALEQALRLYDTHLELIKACDLRIETVLQALAQRRDPPPEPAPAPKRRARPRGSLPTFEIRQPLHRLCGGADITQLAGIAPLTALQFLSEVGTDPSRWPTAKHFTSWLNLAPPTKITGGKPLRAHRPSLKNRAGEILRMAAVSVGRTTSALGAFYRRIAAGRGKAKAVVATARKLAVIIYHLLRGEPLRLDTLSAYEQRYRDNVLRHLRSRAKSLGFALSPITPDAPAGT